MPCRSDYEEYVPTRNVTNSGKTDQKLIESLRKELKELGGKYNSLKTECDKVTQLLCYSCANIFEEFEEEDELADYRLRDWWNDHNAWDRKRTLATFKELWPTGDVTKDGARNYFIKRAEEVHPLSNYHKGEFFELVWRDYTNDINCETQNEIARLEKRIAELKKSIKD